MKTIAPGMMGLTRELTLIVWKVVSVRRSSLGIPSLLFLSWSSWESIQLFSPIGHVVLSRHDEHDPVHQPHCSCYAIISLITKFKR